MSRLSAPHRPEQATYRRKLRRERTAEREVRRLAKLFPCNTCGQPNLPGSGTLGGECLDCLKRTV
jgi:hypothetical protein